MPVTLTRGTKENVEVQVTDLSNAITDLSGSSPHFDVIDDTNAPILTNVAATAVGMLIACLIDTTGFSSSLQHANLYVKFTVGSEVPRLGPFDLYVIGQ
jgi:hypothetical protein